MDFGFSGGQADLIKIFPAIHFGRVAIGFDLKYIESFKFQLAIEFRYRSFRNFSHPFKNKKFKPKKRVY